MQYQLSVPRSKGPSLEIAINPGESLFVLGANGTGKSSLMHQFYVTHRLNARRIVAHRQTWFTSDAASLSAEQKRAAETHIQQLDIQSQARWRDDYSAQRTSIAIIELLDAENVRSRKISGAVDSKNMALAENLSKDDSPIKVINALLRLSDIPIVISIAEGERFQASKSGSTPYSIAELSDGERSALLIAASVLSARAGVLLLIDEPERHLHRSIISPLLSLLFSKRPDCAFVVSTHEILLPIDSPKSRVLLLRDCTYTGAHLSSYDADLVLTCDSIDDDIKKDILGSRRNLLFVEGTEHSLDKPLYSLIFPNASVVARASCHDVEHAVSGIRRSNDLHWVRAF